MISTAQSHSSFIRQTILEHLDRYRLTTLPILERLDALQSTRRTTWCQQLHHLRRSGRIGTAPLFHNRDYFYPAATDRPHSEISKIRHYAMAAFCCLGSVPRERLTAADFQQHFPDLYRPEGRLSYCMEITSGRPRLEFLRVDTAGHGRWDRIIATARSDVSSHREHAAFQRLIQAGQFCVTILTATLPKAVRIEETLRSGTHPSDAAIRVTAIPELLYLLAPPPA
ncbi:hypothetical protein GC176_27620 [bacterium]|nr:hypothetical protein [bacterium]